MEGLPLGFLWFLGFKEKNKKNSLITFIYINKLFIIITMAIVQIAVTIFIFTILFVIFSYSKTDPKIGVWIIVMILFTLVLGLTTTGAEYTKERTHPSFLIGQYSKYNTSPSIS